MQIPSNRLRGLNPLDVLLWTFRRNESDVINLYDAFSALMQISTGANMLNFGYWDSAASPAEAQAALCREAGKMADLASARTLIDVGSGFSEPATIWLRDFPSLQVSCINVNRGQLQFASRLIKESPGLRQGSVALVNSTATALPFATGSVDRIIALESAQHFRPLEGFMSECRRVLSSGGKVILALPVMTEHRTAEMRRLGILSFTWSSEHHTIDAVKRSVAESGMSLTRLEMIGPKVYPPLADYYIKNRESIRRKILEKYPAYVEKILLRSLVKMKQVSCDGTIDYALLSASPQDGALF